MQSFLATFECFFFFSFSIVFLLAIIQLEDIVLITFFTGPCRLPTIAGVLLFVLHYSKGQPIEVTVVFLTSLYFGNLANWV